MFPSYDHVRQAVDEEVVLLHAAYSKFVSDAKKWTGYSLLLLVIVSGLVFTFASQEKPDLYFYFIIIVILITILVIIRKYVELRQVFKSKIISKMARVIVSECQLPMATDEYQYICQFEPGSHVSPQWIRSSRLFPFHIDKYFGEDLFLGQIGLADFQFSEIQLIQERRVKDHKGRIRKVDVTMFKGILFIADFHKSFQGITVLKAENLLTNSFIGKLFTPLRHLFQGSYRGKRIVSNDVENEAFNLAFEINTTDEVEARYLLSSNMIERIMAFRSRHPGKIEISFVDSYMCVALATRKNYFELKMSGKKADFGLQQAYDDLIFFFGMIEAFDLNTRIWSKT